VNNFRVIGKLDPAPLLERLSHHQAHWGQGGREYYEGSAHAQAQSIMIRWVKLPTEDLVAAQGEDHRRIATSLAARVLNDTKSVDHPAAHLLMPEIGEAVMSVLERLGAIGDLGHVMLTRLPAGGAIAAHVDEGIYANLYDRFHVCLAGGPGNIFRCGGEEIHPEPGDIFWFNHKREHSVENLVESGERIHLIVDVMAPHFTELRGIYYQAERVSDLWDEAEPLLQAHYAEIAHYQDIPLDPDKDAYRALEAAGQLRCYTVRDRARLAGYVVFIVRQNMHYKGSLQANQDVLFVLPEYRAGLIGIRLIKEAERRLAAQGVQVVYHHAKRTNKVGELLGRLGYDLVDEIRAKRLDRKG